MTISPFTLTDLEHLQELQPPDWGDLTPRFIFFSQSPLCRPVKLTSGLKVVGVGTSILHKDTAWLACIIVHPDYRNRGYGQAITQHLIDELDRNRYQTIYLDATVYGYPVYVKLGFELEAEYAHFKLTELIDPPRLSPHIQPIDMSLVDSILQLDAIVSGEDRSGIVSEHIPAGMVFVKDQTVRGFYLPTLSEGLIIASHASAGIALMSLRLSQRDFAVLPVLNLPAIQSLENLGLIAFRTSHRMRLGKQRSWRADHIYNRISGQLG